MAYLLLAEQATLSQKLGMKKTYTDLLRKKSDISIIELKNGFMKNALKLCSKYLKPTGKFDEFQSKLSSLVKEVNLCKFLYK